MKKSEIVKCVIGEVLSSTAMHDLDTRTAELKYLLDRLDIEITLEETDAEKAARESVKEGF